MMDKTEACRDDLTIVKDGDAKYNKEANDLCERLNGKVMRLPDENDELLDQTMSDYLVSIDNLVQIGEPVCIWILPDNSQAMIGTSSVQQAYLINTQNNTAHKIKKMFRMRRSVAVPGSPIPSCGTEPCSTPVENSLLCVFSQETVFRLGGLCKEATIDRQYRLAGHSREGFGCKVVLDDYKKYVGPTGWVITRNITDKKWRVTHPDNHSMVVTMINTDTLPVGRNMWYVSDVCREGPSIATLQLSGCHEGQYTCQDGKCLDSQQICDGIQVEYLFLSENIWYLSMQDCDDFSDESNCQTLNILDEKYDKTNPPQNVLVTVRYHIINHCSSLSFKSFSAAM